MEVLRCMLKCSPELRPRVVNNTAVFHLPYPARAHKGPGVMLSGAAS